MHLYMHAGFRYLIFKFEYYKKIHLYSNDSHVHTIPMHQYVNIRSKRQMLVV
jgi:hypothetical protein